jgi:hypothetical protein
MIKLDSAANVSIKVALYGEAKSGKTTSALQFPDPIVLQDGVSLGARFLTRRLISIISIEQLIQACSQLASARGEYKTVVFDDIGLHLCDFFCHKIFVGNVELLMLERRDLPI